MRVIDADLLLKSLNKWWEKSHLQNGFASYFLFEFRKLVAEQPTVNEWILCRERLPECEREVQVTTRKKLKDGTFLYIITNAMYEDGTMLENDSIWHWNECNFEKFNEEEDCYLIDEGWWEYKYYNPDDVWNNVVDDEVIAWMPLPKAYER